MPRYLGRGNINVVDTWDIYTFDRKGHCGYWYNVNIYGTWVKDYLHIMVRNIPLYLYICRYCIKDTRTSVYWKDKIMKLYLHCTVNWKYKSTNSVICQYWYKCSWHDISLGYFCHNGQNVEKYICVRKHLKMSASDNRNLLKSFHIQAHLIVMRSVPHSSNKTGRCFVEFSEITDQVHKTNAICRWKYPTSRYQSKSEKKMQTEFQHWHIVKSGFNLKLYNLNKSF